MIEKTKDARIFDKNSMIDDASFKCCEKMDVIKTQQGEITCRSCGLVHGRVSTSEDRPNYDNNEKKTKQHSVMNDDSKTIIRLGNHGKYSPTVAETFVRLSKIQDKWSRDNNKIKNTTGLKNLLKKLSFEGDSFISLLQDSKHIYFEASKQGFIRGRTIHGMQCASIYYAGEVNEIPISIASLSENTEEKIEIRKCLKFARQITNEIFGTKKRDFISLMIKKLNELGIEQSIQLICINFYRSIPERYKYLLNSKNPLAIIASIIFICCKSENINVTVKDKYGKPCKKKITQKILYKVTGITEVTIRNRVKDLIYWSDENSEIVIKFKNAKMK